MCENWQKPARSFIWKKAGLSVPIGLKGYFSSVGIIHENCNVIVQYVAYFVVRFVQISSKNYGCIQK